MPSFQPFIFENENFVQSDTVYPTDIAVFLNRTEKKLFLWAGKRAKKEFIEDAQRLWVKFTEKYQDFKQINLVQDRQYADFELSKAIRALLAQHSAEENTEKTKSKFNLAAGISAWTGFVCMSGVLLNAIFSLLTPIQGTSLYISEVAFAQSFDLSLIFLSISGGCFVATAICSIIGKNSQLAVPSILTIGIEIGFWFYLFQRDFLFIFQNYGVTPGILEILSEPIINFVNIHGMILGTIGLLFFIAKMTRASDASIKRGSDLDLQGINT